MTISMLLSKSVRSYRILPAMSKVGLVCSRRNKVAVDFVNDSRYTLRPTKYSAFDVVENMLSKEGTDLGVGVLLARNPLCISRSTEEVFTSAECLKRWSAARHSNVRRPCLTAGGNMSIHENIADCGSSVDACSSTSNPIETVSSSGLASNDESHNNHRTAIRENIEKMCSSSAPQDAIIPQHNPFRTTHETTFLFVKSKILFPNEWYIPTLFVSKYMNIHEAAISIKHEVLCMNDERATITSPLPSMAITEDIPKDHPLYDKLKSKIRIFVYRAIYHGLYDEIRCNPEIIQEARWLTASEAKDVLRPSFYKKLSTIF